MNYSINEVPGRLRVTTPMMLGNPLRAAAVQVYLKALNGILSAETNLSAGSIEIRYDAQIVRSEQIIQILTDRGYLSPIRLDQDAQLLSRKISITKDKGRTIVTHIMTAVIP